MTEDEAYRLILARVEQLERENKEQAQRLKTMFDINDKMRDQCRANMKILSRALESLMLEYLAATRKNSETCTHPVYLQARQALAVTPWGALQRVKEWQSGTVKEL